VEFDRAPSPLRGWGYPQPSRTLRCGAPRRPDRLRAVVTRIVILGGGPAGYEAALVAATSHPDTTHVTVIDPEGMGGKPCIRGMRVTVGMIVESLAAGRSIEQLLADFPYLEEQDIRDALAFAARLAQGHDVRLAS